MIKVQFKILLYRLIFNYYFKTMAEKMPGLDNPINELEKLVGALNTKKIITSLLTVVLLSSPAFAGEKGSLSTRNEKTYSDSVTKKSAPAGYTKAIDGSYVIDTGNEKKRGYKQDKVSPKQMEEDIKDALKGFENNPKDSTLDDMKKRLIKLREKLGSIIEKLGPQEAYAQPGPKTNYSGQYYRRNQLPYTSNSEKGDHTKKYIDLQDLNSPLHKKSNDDITTDNQFANRPPTSTSHQENKYETTQKQLNFNPLLPNNGGNRKWDVEYTQNGIEIHSQGNVQGGIEGDGDIEIGEVNIE